MMGYHLWNTALKNDGINVPIAEEKLKQLEKARTEAATAMDQLIQIMMKLEWKGWKPFQVRDQVWLEATNIEDPALPKQIGPRRHRPFCMEKVHSQLSYQLQLPKS